MYEMNRSDPIESIGFGTYSFDPVRLELRKEGQPVQLAAQPSQVLALLLDRNGHVVTRSEIRELLWGDRAVEVDAGINACVRQIRRALGDRYGASAFVETIPRVGYRFTAPIRSLSPDYALATEPEKLVAQRADRTSWRLPAAALAATAMLTLVFLAWANRPTSRAGEAAAPSAADHAEPTITRLAILPFRDLTAPGDESRNSALATGMADDLIAELNGVAPEHLQVIARQSAISASAQDLLADDTYHRLVSTLGVDYLLDGSVRRESNRIRLVVQLVRADDLSVAWSRRIDRDVERLLDVQLDLARQVTTSLLPNVELSGTTARSRSTVHPEARELFLLGRHLVERRTRQDDIRAIPLLEQAARLDPNHAPIRVALARALRSQSGTQIAARRRALLQQALHLDPDSAEAHLSIGRIHLFRDWNWREARIALERAVELHPNMAEARHTLATFYAMQGQSEQAVVQIEVARQLDPVSAALHADSGLVYFLSRRYRTAISACQLALRLEPSRLGCRDILIESHRLLDDFDGARVEALAMVSARGGDQRTRIAISSVSPSDGLATYYDWNLSNLTEHGASPLELAAAHALGGQRRHGIRASEPGGRPADRPGAPRGVGSACRCISNRPSVRGIPTADRTRRRDSSFPLGRGADADRGRSRGVV